MKRTKQQKQQKTWKDEKGHLHGFCGCGNDCSTHPDAGNPFDRCGDCGVITCPDCRVLDMAGRCNDCAAVFYANGNDE